MASFFSCWQLLLWEPPVKGRSDPPQEPSQDRTQYLRAAGTELRRGSDPERANHLLDHLFE